MNGLYLHLCGNDLYFLFVDVLFLDSPEVIFKVAVAMLNQHKEELLKRDNFEEIMDYLKTIVPQITDSTLDQILKEVK